ncbi:MAG TPA: BrnA antitoxin family protein [Terriglobales bacterium]
MKKATAEKRRYIDFSKAKRGPVVKPDPGKTKISIRLDNTVLDYFRDLVSNAGGGNYQTVINNVLLEHIHRQSTPSDSGL